MPQNIRVPKYKSRSLDRVVRGGYVRFVAGVSDSNFGRDIDRTTVDTLWFELVRFKNRGATHQLREEARRMVRVF